MIDLGPPPESEPVYTLEPGDPNLPRYEHLITEDDTPVDNLFSEKQMRLLTEPLHSNWKPDRMFVAFANVGVFSVDQNPALVPDALVSMDVGVPDDPWPKENRSYYIWRYAKAPDVVIEIVSNRKGGELSKKLTQYQRMRVTTYVVFDPQRLLSSEPVRRFELISGRMTETSAIDDPLPEVGLRLVPWQGRYEDLSAPWLRWAYPSGELIETGAESTVRESARADTAEARADTAEARAQALEALLRSHGIDPVEPDSRGSDEPETGTK